MPSHQVSPDKKLSVGNLGVHVLKSYLSGEPRRRLHYGLGETARSKLHFRLELLHHHFIAEPRREQFPSPRRAHVFHVGWRQRIAEVRGDRWEPLLLVGIGRQRQSMRPAQVTGDHFGAGLVQQKASAIEELHQRARA